jgi:DNA-binding NarL/FixJ family response regulator
MLKVLLIDPNQVRGEQVRDRLAELPGISVVKASAPLPALSRVTADKVRLVVAALDDTQANDAWIIQIAHTIFPQLAILAYTSKEIDLPSLERAISVGARSLLADRADRQEFLSVIARALRSTGQVTDLANLNLKAS